MATYRYAVKNIDKYAGDPRRIVARSRWELMYMQALDNSSMVRKWISEPRNLNISYLDPIDKKVKQYWPDFLVQYRDGTLEVLEIKPLKQSIAEKATNNFDKIMLLKNVSKWTAADRFAKSIGGKFRVITEQNLFRKKTTNAARKPNVARKSRGSVKS
jgi:hypothetical protein